MTQPILDMSLAPRETSDAERPADRARPGTLATAEDVSLGTNVLVLFERLAKDPAVDVEKLDRLMQMHERALAKQAEIAFHASMVQAQKAMRSVNADAFNPQTKSRYASYQGLDAAVRPIYTAHGFGLSFNTAESPLPEHVRIVCDVVHEAGHSKRYHVDISADGKGARGADVMTKTHATGSAVSYGMRYLVKMIWNVAVGTEVDDDGNAAGDRREVDKPEGFDAWLAVLESEADNGLPAFEAAWARSKAEYKTHLANTDRSGWSALKARAQRATPSRGRR